MLRRISRPWMALLSVIAALWVGGCSRADDSAPAPEPAPAPFASVHESLCDSVRAAEMGDAATAEARFADAHGGLHDLAAAVAEEEEAADRAVAARLLEAKRRVEQAGAGAGSAELRALSAAASESIEALGGPAPAECE